MCSVRFNKQLLRTRLNKLLYILNKIQVKKYKGRGGSTQTIDSPQIPRKSRKVHGTEVFDFVIIAACVGFYLQHWEFVKSCKLELREVGTLADILTHPLQRGFHILKVKVFMKQAPELMFAQGLVHLTSILRGGQNFQQTFRIMGWHQKQAITSKSVKKNTTSVLSAFLQWGVVIELKITKHNLTQEKWPLDYDGLSWL